VALSAAASAGGALPSSSVIGSGHFIETGGPFELSVNARGEFQVEGPVTCMVVVGNRASIKYRFRRSSGPGAPPQDGGVQVYIEDNGKPQNGVPVDRVATEPPQPPASFDAAAGVCTDRP
jgi:hypothetical protein